MSMDRLRGRRGSVMILALVVLVFAIIVGVSFARTAVLSKGYAAQERQLSQAYYAAESGLTEVLQRPDLYASGMFPSGYTPVSSYQSPEFALPGGEDLTFSFTAELVRGNVYRIDSIGRTPYAAAMASAEVAITTLESLVAGTAFHMGSSTGTPDTIGVPGGGLGNASAVIHHFAGSDVSVYGTLYFRTAETDPHNVLQEEKFYDIHGGDFYTKNAHNPVPKRGDPDYLDWAAWLEKGGELDEYAQFPVHVADVVRASVELPAAGWTIDPPIDNKVLKVGSGWPGPVEGTTPDWIVITEEQKSKVETVEGTGYVKFEGQSKVNLKSVVPHGPLTIVSESTLEIGSVGTFTKNPNGHKYDVYDTGGHPIYVVSDDSIFLGGTDRNWDPYPLTGDAKWNNCYFLGSGSILWAQHDLIIAGQVRPGKYTDYPAYEMDASWTGAGPEPDRFEIFEWNVDDSLQPSPLPKGSLFLVSRGERPDGNFSTLGLHTMDSGGFVFAGSRVRIYRLRLRGVAMFQDPYRGRKPTGQSEEVLGVAQLNLTADTGMMYWDSTINSILMSTIRRLK